MATDEDDFLSRWSRRKRAVAEEAAVAVPPIEIEPELEPETEEEETVLLERLGLPVPETLGEGDDFSGFMSAGVPEFLRKRALRVLWRSNPVLANLDGLNDYDDDFNSPELTQKVLATGYQIGRGFVKQVLDVSEDAAAAPEKDLPVAAETSDSEPTETKEVSEEVSVVEIPVDETPDVSIRPRRMRFET